jgi:hypothetical protein
MFGNLSKILGNVNLPGGIGQVISGASAVDQRQAFIAVLLATAASAGQKQNFNLEVEINDLWTRLGNLRTQSSAPGVGALLTKALSGVSELNNGILRALQGTLNDKR